MHNVLFQIDPGCMQIVARMAGFNYGTSFVGISLEPAGMCKQIAKPGYFL